MLVGSFAIGLTWGWLLALVQRPARDRRRSLAILTVATGLVLALQGWASGAGALAAAVVGVLVGLAAHGAWIASLEQRCGT